MGFRNIPHSTGTCINESWITKRNKPKQIAQTDSLYTINSLKAVLDKDYAFESLSRQTKLEKNDILFVAKYQIS